MTAIEKSLLQFLRGEEAHGESPEPVRRQREQQGKCVVTAGYTGSGWAGLNNLGSGAQGLSLSVWHLAPGDEGRWPRV